MKLDFLFALGFIFVALSSFATVNGQARCCTASKYSMMMRQKLAQVIQGSPQTLDINGMFYFDVSQQKQAWNGTVIPSTGMNIHTMTIWDYTKRAMYQVNLGARTCQRMNMSTPLTQCLPANSIHFGSFVMGGSLNVDGWQYQVNMPFPVSASAFVTQSGGSCVMVSIGQTQRFNNIDQMIGTAALNYSTSVPSNAFVLPSYCTQQQQRRQTHAATTAFVGFQRFL